MAVLSPGYHPMLHTAGSLERLLRAAGFGAVHVVREGETLHAAAGADAFAWDAAGALPDGAVARYLDERADTLATGLAARQGLLQQLANEAVNRGDAATAARALSAARRDAARPPRRGPRRRAGRRAAGQGRRLRRRVRRRRARRGAGR